MPALLLSPTAILRYPKDGGDKQMKLHYYPETDSLYIDLNSKPSVDSREIVSGLVADFDVLEILQGLESHGHYHVRWIIIIDVIADYDPPCKPIHAGKNRGFANRGEFD